MLEITYCTVSWKRNLLFRLSPCVVAVEDSDSQFTSVVSSTTPKQQIHFITGIMSVRVNCDFVFEFLKFKNHYILL